MPKFLAASETFLISDQFDGPFFEFVREFSAYCFLHVNTSKEHPKRS